MNVRAKILIVEDSPTQALHSKYLFEKNGYEITFAANGKKALAVARRMAPDLVLSDIHMPVMGGLEMSSAMRKDKTLKRVPIIFVTTLSHPRDVIHGLNAGVEYCLSKPYDDAFLLSKVEEILANPVSQRRNGKAFEVTLAGEHYVITCSHEQTLRLLFCAYENAIRHSRRQIEIEAAMEGLNEELKGMNEALEIKVEERSAQLTEATNILEEEIEEGMQTERKLQKTLDALKESTAQVAQAEKKFAVALLSAGVAHELNNPMMGILHSAQYCIKHTDEDDKTYGVLKDIEHETERCIDIVKNLLAFSRTEKQGKAMFERENLSAVVDRVLGLLSYRIEKDNVSVTKHIAEGTPGVWVKVGDIHQVFLNLISNALDAIQDSQKKEIRVHVWPEGECVHVRVTDTGCGIDAQTLQRIFDPFFTTKPVGKGTGLGLSVSLGIIEADGGKLTCSSKPGVGTSFEILLPVNRRRD
jgi:C4-dicarboxylate-specific signal transduction histidine kinase/CheY-like chemotaxis protein